VTGDLVEFAEAPARFMAPAPGRLLRVTDGYALAHDFGHTWAAVEGIRLRAEDVAGALAEVRAALTGSGAARCSWWLTERSTPPDLEARLLEARLVRDDADYLHAAMLLTTEPPQVDGIAVRRVTTLAEFAEARRVSLAAFANPNQHVPTDAEIAVQWEHAVDPTFAAWVDGRMAAVGRATFTSRGAYLTGGATAEWARGRGAYRAIVRARWDAAVEAGTPALGVGAGPMSRPILERLGFEQVLLLRRVEDVLSPA
jgi:hypothetical protein